MEFSSRQKTERHKAFSILEVILAAGIFSVFSAAALLFMFGSLKAEQQGNMAEQGHAYAREGLEAVRAIRDRSFDDLSDTEGTGVVFSDGRWSFAGEDDAFDIFTRSIVISSVMRDGEGNITSVGDTDPDMKKVVSRVSWTSPSGQEVSSELTGYLSRRQPL